MLNNYLSVLYKHNIQVENENVGLKVGGTNIPLPPPPPPPASYASDIYIYITFVNSVTFSLSLSLSVFLSAFPISIYIICVSNNVYIYLIYPNRPPHYHTRARTYTHKQTKHPINIQLSYKTDRVGVN